MVGRGGRRILQEARPADAGGIGGADQHVGTELIAQLYRREGVGVVLFAGHEGQGLGGVVVAEGAVVGAGGLDPHAGEDAELANLRLVLGVACVDVLAGGEHAGVIDAARRGPGQGGCEDLVDVDVRTIGIEAIEVGDGGRRCLRERQGRDRVGER